MQSISLSRSILNSENVPDSDGFQLET